MKGDTQHTYMMVFLIIAITSMGCAMNGSVNEDAVAGSPNGSFDPLSQPKVSTPKEPFLDPLVFFSDQAYVVRALPDDPGTDPGGGIADPEAGANGSGTPGVAAGTDAAFIGGYDQLIGHLKAHTLEHIAPGIGWLKPPTVHFTVNAEGGTEAVSLIATSGNAELDRMFVALLEDLPKWKPATDAAGTPVAQAFEFLVTQGGGC